MMIHIVLIFDPKTLLIHLNPSHDEKKGERTKKTNCTNNKNRKKRTITKEKQTKKYLQMLHCALFSCDISFFLIRKWLKKKEKETKAEKQPGKMNQEITITFTIANLMQ
jgi:hypothetical protein